MSRVLTSLHGRLAGLDSNGKMVVRKGFRAGDHGSQIDLPSPSRATFFDDFVGDTLNTNAWVALEGTDSATSDAAILSGGIGGVLRMTTGDAGTGLAADMEQLSVNALQWQASNGDLVFEARVKLSAITTCYVFLGFTDTVSFEAPIESAASGDTLTSTASDAVGFMFDTRMSTDDWWLVGVAGDTDATAQDVGSAPVAAEYATYRVEVDADGVASFFINGVQVGSRMAGAVTAGTDLTPTLAVSKTSVAASMTMDVDYVHVSMNRAANGGAV